MASLEHEAVVELLRNRPELALELLAAVRPEFADMARLGGAEACIESNDFGDAKPLERTADFVASFGTEPDAVRVIVEMQLFAGRATYRLSSTAMLRAAVRSSPSSRLEHTEITPMY